MNILDDRAQWEAEYRAGWLGHFQTTGEQDWKRYKRPTNLQAPAGPGVDLAHSRLMLITSSGAYLRGAQMPFDAPNPLGDYTVRAFPLATPLAALAYAHDHYDHTAVDADPQVLVPLRHLEALAAEGVIGALTPSVVSFSGYHPDVGRVLDETLPALVAVARAEGAQAALLVPS